jgi:exodeoxyribonuclease VII small subunit
MKDLGFEEALKRLEAIVTKLEAGNLLLEEALKAFGEGVGLARICAVRLRRGKGRSPSFCGPKEANWRRGHLISFRKGRRRPDVL